MLTLRISPAGGGPGSGVPSDRSSPMPVLKMTTASNSPPTTRQAKMDMPSPVWVPILMFGLLGLGALVIVLNYLGVLPGDTDNKYLAVGLVMILGGIVTATQYR